MIIYAGPSELDGSPIVAIVTGLARNSTNRKTGSMPQVWIIRADMHPVEALTTGADASICGNCPHRPQVTGRDALKRSNRTCYVNAMAIGSIYRSYAAGKYEPVSPELAGMRLAGMRVRIGAYGDPAAVPLRVWDALLAHCESTGYTHQWRTCDTRFAEYCMASCDTPLDVLTAKMLGYRAFYVADVAHVRSVEAVKLTTCPASVEAGKKVTCSQCMGCSGTRSNRRADFTILLH